MVLRTLTVLVFVWLIAGTPAMADAAWEGVFNFQSKLAEQGNAESQFKLGEMYEEGLGVEQSDDLAKQWYGKAAAQGHAEAASRLSGYEARKQERLGRSSQDQARREAEAREQAAREQARREADARDQARREAEAREAAAREQARREAAAREQARREAAAREQARREAAAREQAAREQARREAEARQQAEREAEARRLAEEKAAQEEAARKEQEKGFSTDPCASPAARFTSTCRDR